ncbi:hypothetical protein GCM10027447_27290 [Glycomyces halotolerans]
MSEPFGDVLRRRAAEGGGASAGLTEGALHRARRIGRRRLAAGTLGAVTGIALAGMAAAALVLPDEGTFVPPAGETTAPAEAPTTDGDGCGAMRPSEWDEHGFSWPGLEPSGSQAALEALPERLYFRVGLMHPGPYTALLEGGAATSLDGGEPSGYYSVAPDGRRALLSGSEAEGESCGWSLVDLSEPDAAPVATFTVDWSCPPSWAPDSDRVVITEPESVGDPESYVFDLVTGERVPLPAGVGCSPLWTPDGRYLVGEGAAVRPDGSERVELPGIAAWDDDPTVLGLGSVSADLSSACLHVDETAGDGRPFDHCGRYVDTATGAELELPVEEETQDVVFLPDGAMLVAAMSEAGSTLYFVDAAGEVTEQRRLPWTASDIEWIRLVGYYTD